jgi:hypothetical protein
MRFARNNWRILEMKRIIIASLVFGIASSAFAQTATQSTDAFAAVIDQQKAAQAAVDYAAQVKAEHEAARQQALDDESAQLDMEFKRAKAAHANDYALADLKRENAQTDVIQSTADATRNYSKQRPVAPTVIVRCNYWGC